MKEQIAPPCYCAVLYYVVGGSRGLSFWWEEPGRGVSVCGLWQRVAWELVPRGRWDVWNETVFRTYARGACA